MNEPMRHELFSPFVSDVLPLKNRIVMAPLTRSRAIGNLPNELITEYYRQRTSAGLIISESIIPSPNGLTYPRIPGIFNDEQTDAWKKVTDAVHVNGGKIFAQIMHPGRVGNVINLPDGARLISASPISADIDVWTDARGLVKSDTPEEMGEACIRQTIQEFAQAAQNAIRAGFDGVELHGANGYLLEQFLNPNTNVRRDSYGGSVEKRSKFVIDVVKAVADAIGKDKLGIRFSPYNIWAGMSHYYDINKTYAYLAKQMNVLGIAYIHVVDAVTRFSQEGDGLHEAITACFRDIRIHFSGLLILNGGFTRERALQAITSQRADLISFGIPFIANPDLPYRLEHNLELAEADRATFYTATEKGFTDYPVYNKAAD